MKLADLELTPGSTFDASELRDAFDRGMTGRGIEICYDEEDQRYLRLFSTDTGPYADEVTGGQFSYIGEGQQGDQTLTAGNRYLANAVDAPLPIFFFYRETDDSPWEYQGKVDALDFAPIEQTGRRVFRFTLQRRSEVRERINRSEAAADIDTPERVSSTRTRIVRDTQLIQDLKAQYDSTCQVCGERRQQGPEKAYAEGHHIKPLGRPHDGPDTAANVLVLCPNHHADFDYGTIEVDPNSYTIAHAYDDEVDGKTLHVSQNHELAEVYLEYHNRHIAAF